MFETFRGTEYGWELGPSLEDGIERSFVFGLVEGLTRADVDEHWKAEVSALLARICPGARLGTPMDYAATSLIKWRKLEAVYRTAIRRIFVLGSHSQATILNRSKSNLVYGKDLIWHPKFHYNTHISSVIENRVGLDKMDEILKLLQDATGSKDFKAANAEVKDSIVEALAKAERGRRGFYIVSQFAWLPRSREPEQVEAGEYAKECQRYQTSVAGKRAKRLLLENLTEAQERDYFHHGYFFVMPNNQDCPLHKRRIYVIERSFPNGNVLRVKQRKSIGGKWHWYPEQTYCFHTKDPHAVDDILLSQKLTLENQESVFLNEANASNPYLDGRAPLAISKRSV